jgi:hypothetical protein
MHSEWLKLVLFLLGYVVLMRWCCRRSGCPRVCREHAGSLDLGSRAQRSKGRLTNAGLRICRVWGEGHGRTNVISGENHETA